MPLFAIVPLILFKLVSNVPALVTFPTTLPTSLLNVPPVISTLPLTKPLSELSNVPDVETLPATFPPLLLNVPLFEETLPLTSLPLLLNVPLFSVTLPFTLPLLLNSALSPVLDTSPVKVPALFAVPELATSELTLLLKFAVAPSFTVMLF